MTRHAKEQEKKQEPPPAPAPDGAGTDGAGEPAAGAPPSELEALKDRCLRLQADFDNYRKRHARERNEIVRRANEDLLTELLPVLDHFELGFEAARKQGLPDAILDGLKLVYDQLVGVLSRFGLAGFDAVGEVFDPHAHEAIATLPSDRQPKDVVIQQVRRGYRLGDQLLRPAQVILSAGLPETSTELPPADETAPAES